LARLSGRLPTDKEQIEKARTFSAPYYSHIMKNIGKLPQFP
jgi:hypothetical protein